MKDGAILGLVLHKDGLWSIPNMPSVRGTKGIDIKEVGMDKMPLEALKGHPL